MGRKVRRVPVQLDTGDIQELSFEEIKVILRGADDLIMQGGRNLLAKILKGSREAKVLELGLDKSHVYGYFKELPISKIMAKIDWLITNEYLAIEYDYRLPLLVYTEKGWEIEKETYAQELFEKFSRIITGELGVEFLDDLKDRNRAMILLLLKIIEDSGDRRYIPLLDYWATNEYKKVRHAIRGVIDKLDLADSQKLQL